MLPTLPREDLRHDLRSSKLTQFRRDTAKRSLRVITLMLLDAMLLYLSWQIAGIYGTPTNSAWDATEFTALVPILAINLAILTTRGLYKSGAYRRDYLGLIKAISLANSLLLLIAFFYNPKQFVSRSHFLVFWLVGLLLLCAERFAIERAVCLLRQLGWLHYPTFLIAEPEDAEQCIRLIEQENRYNLTGVADPRSLDRLQRDHTFETLRNLGVVEAFVTWNAIKNRQFLSWRFQTDGITLHVLPIGLEPLLKSSAPWSMGGFPVLAFSPRTITGVDFLIKRVLDICTGLVFVTVLSPIYFAIALAIRLDSPGPIFYRQTRIGLSSRPFKVWKFRTMVVNADELQKALEAQNETKDGILFKIKDDPRVTRVGKFLRSWSLDELPQIFNVVLGQMSFVGPRPLPVRDVEKFSPSHFVRHEVLPGITGLWQISGRSNITDFEEVIRLDMAYIENWSLQLDLSILLKTVQVVGSAI